MMVRIISSTSQEYLEKLELNDEDAVEFKVADGERGPKAVDISPL